MHFLAELVDAAERGLWEYFVLLLALLNFFVGVFNLLPIPPLDGSRLLSIFLPPSRQNIVYFLDQYGIFLLLGLLILAPNLLTPLFRAIIRFLYGLVGLI